MALNHTYTVARDTLLRGGTQPRGSASMLLRLFQRQHHSSLFYTAEGGARQREEWESERVLAHPQLLPISSHRGQELKGICHKTISHSLFTRIYFVLR